MRFQAQAAPASFRSPRIIAMALLIAGGGFAIDVLVSGQPTTHLLGPAVAIGAGIALWALTRGSSGAAPAPRAHAEEGDADTDTDALAGPTARGDAPPAGPYPRLGGTAGHGGPHAFPMSGARRRSGKSSRGFTLIEMLMTVTITALVLGMIGGILISVINASEKIEAKLRTEKAGYGVLSLVRRDLTGVYAYAMGGPAFKGEDKSSFGMDADELHFVTTANVVETDDGSRPDFVEVGYRFDEEDDHLVMFRRAEPFAGDPLTGQGDYVELLRGIQSFNLEYLDPENNAWKERWENEEGLPAAVKVVLELALSEAQERYAQNAQVDIPPPRYEMIVGIPVTNELPDEEEGGGDAPPGGN